MNAGTAPAPESGRGTSMNRFFVAALVAGALPVRAPTIFFSMTRARARRRRRRSTRRVDRGRHDRRGRDDRGRRASEGRERHRRRAGHLDRAARFEDPVRSHDDVQRAKRDVLLAPELDDQTVRVRHEHGRAARALRRRDDVLGAGQLRVARPHGLPVLRDRRKLTAGARARATTSLRR